MPKKNNKIIVPSSNEPVLKTEEIDLDYKNKNIVLDLSFPFLFYFITFGDFTNKFKTPSDYIKYSNYLHRMFLPEKSRTSINTICSRESAFCKHSHIIENEKIDMIKKIINAAYIHKNMDQNCAEQFIDQNILDINMWQVGLANSYGRIFGYFNQNVFKPILLDPHHLIYKSENGKVRRRSDIKTLNFFPNKISTFEYKKQCIKCGSNEEPLHQVNDEVMGMDFYFCEKCLFELIDNFTK